MELRDNNTCLRSVISRRALISLSLAVWVNPFQIVASTLRSRWHIPAENAPHAGCWMAWPARSDIWGHDLSAVRDVCARVARAVSAFEPVTMFARPSHAKEAATACGPRTRVVSLQIDDCWIRDTGPLIAADREGVLAGSVLNFNGWGNKQPHTADAAVAARLCQSIGVAQHIVPFVSEGGAWEFDGEATALTTESAVLNPNRNPQLTKADVESAARRFFGVEKIIWLPGARDYWTDGHVDGIARFVRPGDVVIETASDPRDPDAPWLARDAAALRSATDARGRTLGITTLQRAPRVRSRSPDFCNCYVNYYLANGGLIMARFGDAVADARARDVVAALYPHRRIVQLDIDALAAGGGGIHCITLQQPLGRGGAEKMDAS